MSENHDKAIAGLILTVLLVAYAGGYAALRFTGQATVFHYGTGDRELWSNIDRIPMVGSALQISYLPLIHIECALRLLEWSP
jgi:hypothetical protein